MINNFSPNMLKTYQICPKKFYYKFIEKIIIPKNFTPFEKGQKIHALANYFLKNINISRIETALSIQEKQLWEKLLNNEFFRMDCVKTEFPMQIKISDYWIGGRIDAIVKNGENYYILDYKTGSPPSNPQYDLQTIVYFLCVERYLKTFTSLNFVYIDLKNNKNVLINYDNEVKRKYEALILDYCNKITNEQIYSAAQDEQICKNCEYNKICSPEQCFF